MDKYIKISSQKENTGMTMIEIVLVVLILGIAGSIASVSFSNIVNTTRLNKSSSKVKEMMIYAQTLAKNTGGTYYIDCISVNNQCRLYEGLGPKSKNILIFDNTLNPPGNDIWCVKNVTIRDSTTIVYQENKIFGNCADTGNFLTDFKEYKTPKTGSDLTLSYTLFDTRTIDEIRVSFNGMFIENGGTTNANHWGKTRNTRLPTNGFKQGDIINPVSKKPYHLYFNNDNDLYGTITSTLFSPLIFLPGGKIYQGGELRVTYAGVCKSIKATTETEKIEMSNSCV